MTRADLSTSLGGADRIEWLPTSLGSLADRAAAFSTLLLQDWLADNAQTIIQWTHDAKGNDIMGAKGYKINVTNEMLASPHGYRVAHWSLAAYSRSGDEKEAVIGRTPEGKPSYVASADGAPKVVLVGHWNKSAVAQFPGALRVYGAHGAMRVLLRIHYTFSECLIKF